MNPKYVTDIEHSKKLIASGWCKSTEWHWHLGMDKEYHLVEREKCLLFVLKSPAPLTDELLEEMPFNIELEKPENGNYHIIVLPQLLIPYYSTRYSMDPSTLPNALADLYCWWMRRLNRSLQ